MSALDFLPIFLSYQ